MRAPACLLLAALFILLGCEAVPYHKREKAQSPLMQVETSATHTHFRQKVFYSREGAAGGIGSSAGGGCGCY